MTERRATSLGRLGADGLAWIMLALLGLPLAALLLSSSPRELLAGLSDPSLGDALALTLRTTVVAMVVIVGAGTPLSWRLARRPGAWQRIVAPLLELPIVIPPAVIGIALLLAFGRNGLFAPWTGITGASIPFTTTAVVVAQIVVSAPFFVQSATAAFRAVDEDLLIVARTLGASRARTFATVAVPAALPGLAAGVGLAWARAIGEFGATLLFAGNLPGRTQTMPLAIYAALERDLGAARAISIVLAVVALGVLLFVRALPRLLGMRPALPRRQSR